MTEVWERRLHDARRRAPKTLDFDALLLAHRDRNEALAKLWLTENSPNAFAVLEIRIKASGHAKRRLRRYREMIPFKTGTPGLLWSRHVTSLEWLALITVEVAAAAARAEVTDIDWSLLDVREALSVSP